MSQSPQRKSEAARRANRVVHSRTMIFMVLLGVVTFVMLFFRLYDLQIRQHDMLEEKAVMQQTASSVVTASRGTIYDRNGNALAISATAETIFLSPKEIADNEEDKALIASNLMSILGVDQADLLTMMEDVESQYKIVARRAEQELADKVREFIDANDISGIYLVPDSKRYYPYGSLASHVIGFVGTDNNGLYGLEAYYDESLQGTNGLTITSKNAAGTDVLYQYEQYYDAENGKNLVTTIDTNIQYYLEKALGDMEAKYGTGVGAQGIIMNAKTGAIYAMASLPTYDPNDPFAVYSDFLADDLEGLEEDEYNEQRAALQLLQWRNRSINDTYEPGSTGKILTLSIALEEGKTSLNHSYDCSGSMEVSTARINCSKRTGHGHQSLKVAVGNSCNPAFINLGLAVGTSTYYDYMEAFGLKEKTGIDLGGEATGIFREESAFDTLDLACYAFGQNYNVTALELITAQAACVNGGYLNQPYVVEQILDDEGNVVFQHDNTPIRQVISNDTSAKACEILEYVVSDGTGANGQVPGYRIGGKTGTADKGKTGDIVVSFCAFAPADDPEIIMLLTLDTPSRVTGTYPSGGNMVAPFCSQILSDVLPYLGYEPEYEEGEYVSADATVINVIGDTVEEATKRLQAIGFGVKTVGDGDKVTDQTPIGGAIVPGSADIILYLGVDKPEGPSVVPSVVGLSAEKANKAITDAGLIMRVTGAASSDSGNVFVISQTEEAGTQVEAGTVMTVQLGDTSVRD